MGCNIQEFSIGDTSVRDALTLHQITYLDKYLDAVQGQETLIRDAMSKGRNILGPHRPRDALFEGRNIRDFSFGDTLFGDTSSCVDKI
jgi:hypothetical protein